MKKTILILSVLLLVKNLNAQTIVWQPLGQQQGGGMAFGQNSAHTKIYRSTYWSGIHMSLDSGYTWTSIFPDSLHGVSSAAVRSDTLFGDFTQCINAGIQYTANDGLQWTRLDNGFIDTANVYQIAVNQTKLFVAAYQVVYMTSDLGQTWQTYSTPGGAYSVCTEGNNICVGSNGKVFISNDNGITWQTKIIPGTSGYAAWKVFISGNRIFAGTGLGLYLSMNNGNSWTLVGMSGKNVLACRLFGNYGFAGTDNSSGTAKIYFSTDSGSTWILSSTGIPATTTGIWDFTMLNNKIIAGAWGTGIWYSNFTTGINILNENKETVSIFPNPASDYFTIQYDLSAQAGFSLSDLFGHEILQKEINFKSNDLKIETDGLPDGIYIWKINCGNRVIHSGKLVILRQ